MQSWFLLQNYVTLNNITQPPQHTHTHTHIHTHTHTHTHTKIKISDSPSKDSSKIWSWRGEGMPCVLWSFYPVFWPALSSLYPRFNRFSVSNRKPIQIIETVKQIGRYLIYYANNRAKPEKIGHALKRRPCWEGLTCLIPSVFCMLPFYVFLKPKP